LRLITSLSEPILTLAASAFSVWSSATPAPELMLTVSQPASASARPVAISQFLPVNMLLSIALELSLSMRCDRSGTPPILQNAQALTRFG
jgi:hypothetical protein